MPCIYIWALIKSITKATLKYKQYNFFFISFNIITCRDELAAGVYKRTKQKDKPIIIPKYIFVIIINTHYHQLNNHFSAVELGSGLYRWGRYEEREKQLVKLVDQQAHMENASKSTFIPEQLFTFHRLNAITSKQQREALKEAGAQTDS